MTALRETVSNLEARLTHLEETVQGFIKKRKNRKLPAKPHPAEKMTQAEVLTWLKTQGIVREPTMKEIQMAAEWQALPESAKNRQIQAMHRLVLTPPLSQIILENRR